MIKKGGDPLRTRNIARCALMVALMVLCAWLALPTGGSGAITLQTLGIFLALGLLGGRKGVICIGVYLCLGALGLPVFAGFQGGAALFGPTGGFLWAFVPAGILFCLTEKKLPMWLNLVLCQLTLYLGGTLWLWLQIDLPIHKILWITLIPYLIPDALKLILSLFLTQKLHPVIQK